MTKTGVASRMVAGLLLAGILVACGPQEQADLVLLNGKIVTMEKAQPQAEALAAVDGKVLALGASRAIQRYVGSETRVIDLAGALAVPGLIDSHGHFSSMGLAKMRLDLTKVQNWDEIVAMVQAAAEQTLPGEWIMGRGWHQEKWNATPQPNVDGLPVHHELSLASPDNPVMLTHASGHSCIANAKAMELSGVTSTTPDPDGGEIVKDTQGNPIGVFRETAQGLLRVHQRGYDEVGASERAQTHLRKALGLANQECLAKGITSFHDAGASFDTVALFRTMYQEGRLGVRLNVMLNESNESLRRRIAEYRLIGVVDNHLTVRSIKRLIDGALGAHGAWLLEPYDSLPTSVGLNTYPVEELKETARIAMENGFQLCTHAIGDRGNRETLDVYEWAINEYPAAGDHRWRIEHAQHLHPIDIPRFSALGVIAAMQGIHCTSDAPWVFKRLGASRAEDGAYVWRKLLDTGAVISNGTDVPVEDVDPIASFHASVTRRTASGELFFPDQRMTREEALRSYTLNGAYAAFEEEIKGSLATGKLADITVLSRDIMTVPDEEIPGTQVLYTIVGGQVLYEKDGR